ncbi:hypothetical protein Hanom_Chr11g01024711 [Helianthus anomalus]
MCVSYIYNPSRSKLTNHFHGQNCNCKRYKSKTLTLEHQPYRNTEQNRPVHRR